MRSTDIRVVDTGVTFHDVLLDHPLRLAGATVDRFTVTEVTAVVEDRAGRMAEGVGAGVLSVPWSWPRSGLSWEERDAAMRVLTSRFAGAAIGGEHAGPLDHANALHGAGVDDVPALAVALAMAGVDNALHDAWARAAMRPASELYAHEHPGLHFGPPRTRLPIQHVVGVGDPLDRPDDRPLDRPQAGTQAGTHGNGPTHADDVPSLREWIELEGIAHVKVKLIGRDPREDAARVADVHRVLRDHTNAPISLSLDPNEGYESAAAVLEMLDALRADAPDAYTAVAYLEQPIPRDAPPDPEGLRALGARVPVIADEGLAGDSDLATLAEHGWSGLVVKAAKGQSLALTSYAHARAHGLFVVVQDLTAVGPALAHSARLAATLDLSWPAFEYNSRQYAPKANRRMAEGRPELVTVRDGHIVVGPPRVGLY